MADRTAANTVRITGLATDVGWGAGRGALAG
jgi:hypothetical protein